MLTRFNQNLVIYRKYWGGWSWTLLEISPVQMLLEQFELISAKDSALHFLIHWIFWLSKSSNRISKSIFFSDKVINPQERQKLNLVPLTISQTVNLMGFINNLKALLKVIQWIDFCLLTGFICLPFTIAFQTVGV